MINRTTRLRWRRRLRRGKRQVEDIGFQAEDQLERNFIRRLNRLFNVRRFVAGWVIFICILMVGLIMQIRALSPYYQELAPVPGGTFTEGILGAFTNSNPLYAAGGVDGAVSSLVFASLMKHDSNNQLTGDLAESIQTDERGLNYTVKLKPNLTWHDGQPLTSADVAYTYQTIQNPDAKSPLFGSWRGIKIEAPDPVTIVFGLPNALISFPFALTNGIVPKHILENTPPSQLRSIDFNTLNPVGAGPFKWRAIEVRGDKVDTREEQISLVPFDKYHGGRPKLDQFVVRAFRTEESLLSSFNNQELNGMVGLARLPENFDNDPAIKQVSVPIAGQVMVFLKTTNEFLGDVKVRQALVKATDTLALIKGLGYPAIASRSPFLPTHVGYDKSITQLPFNLEEANALLESAGWTRGEDGVRVKDGKPLAFELLAQNNPEYEYVTRTLQRQWLEIGVSVEIPQSDQQIDQFQQNVALHNYDALLYGISLGSDPDVFPYWHSSQADAAASNRLNLSEYKSTVTDKALEAGRTREDASLRTIKYKPFLEAWRNDAPAIALYQPRFLYVVRAPFYGLQQKVINNATERYSNVENWMIREEKQTRQQ